MKMNLELLFQSLNWNLFISIVALIVSFGSVCYSTQIGKKLQKEQQKFEKNLWVQTVLQKANATVVKNRTEINGIMNVARITETPPSEEIMGEVVKLFTETQNIYTGICHHFNPDVQSVIEKATDEVKRLTEGVTKDIVEDKGWITVTQKEYASAMAAYTKLVFEKISEKLEASALD